MLADMPRMQRHRRMFLALLILGTLTLHAPGATYYVDGQAPKASDDHPGTAEAPWKTVSLSIFAPGSTLTR